MAKEKKTIENGDFAEPSAGADVGTSEEGIVVMPARPYGVGCDIHSKKAQVSVMVRNGDKTVEFPKEFDTDIESLMRAREWVVSTIEGKSSPPVKVDPDELAYVIESTSMYHIIVIVAWGGKPSVVNPATARAGTKKTDRIDAKMLCLQGLLGTWPASYIPTEAIQTLRMLVAERDNFSMLATRASNRINSNLLRFGDTSGREGSVTLDKRVRGHVEAFLKGLPDDSGLVTAGVPDEARQMFIDEYAEYDRCMEKAEELDRVIIETVRLMEWETKDGVLKGDEMLANLDSVPGIGEHTAAIWLCRTVTPRRFANAKALCAYAGFDPSLRVSAGKVTSGKKKRKGDKLLHKSLSLAASGLVNRRSEPFGEWGYRIQVTSRKRGKAVNAVAKRLATALYWVQSKGRPFTYDGYKSAKEPAVIDMPVEELAEVNPAFRRYFRALGAAGICTTSQMVHEYHVCRLQCAKGLGPRFFVLVKEFIDNQKPYKKHLEEKGK